MKRLLVAVAVAASACSTGLNYDPVFVSVGAARADSDAECPEGSTCVAVPLTALSEAAGETGRCEIYETPGDPATMEPLATDEITVPENQSDEFELPIEWQVTIPTDVDPGSLNAVCSPMVEG